VPPTGTDELRDLPPGSVQTVSGRVSSAAELGQSAATPFTAVQLARLDEALTLVSRRTQLWFSVYLGDLGEDSHASATRLYDQLGTAGTDAVLVAVDPCRRTVDIVTGPEARVRLADRGCKLAVMSMVASFKERTWSAACCPVCGCSPTRRESRTHGH
jgi:hypothetical protein